MIRSAAPHFCQSDHGPLWIDARSERPSRDRFSSASSAASWLASTPSPVASGRFARIADNRHPLPVPRSAMKTGALSGMRARAASTKISLSGRGINARPSLRNSRPKNSVEPMMCCRGSRAARRKILLEYAELISSETLPPPRAIRSED